MNTKTPVEMTMTTPSINDAIMYWLNTVILKENVEVNSIVFNKQTENFTIKFNRKED